MSQRIVGQCRQADHGVVPGQVGWPGIPDVAGRPQAGLRDGAEIASLVETEIKSLDLVPGCVQERNENGSDIAAITRNQDLHS